MRMNKHVVGVDLGGTKVEACLLDQDRTLITRQRIPSEASKGMDHVIQNIANVIRKVSEGRDFAAVGMGTPGTYVPSEDRLYGAPHTPVYEEAGLIQGLQKRLDVPLVVDNDANCLALAEFFASCEGKYRYVMAVILAFDEAVFFRDPSENGADHQSEIGRFGRCFRGGLSSFA